MTAAGPGRRAPGGQRHGTVVIGIGNEFRRDDGAGPAVIGRLRAAAPKARLVVSDGDPAGLIEEWSAASLAIVIDAVRADPARPPDPGRTLLLEAGQAIGDARTVSSHGLGLRAALDLAEALGRLPGRLIVHGIEVAECGYGAGLSPAVAAGVERVSSAVLAEIGSGGLR